jgi:dihydropteroate synthase
MVMSTKNTELKTVDYFSNGKIITFNKPLVMAIVNITPDSFYDGGKFGAINDVARDVEEKIRAGANIIDLGAASSRPGSAIISIEEEWQRLQPVLELLRKEFPQIIISVDTWRAEIAKNAVDAGADIINDIGGGTFDPHMFATIAKLDVPYVLMHIQGTPETMHHAPHYTDVVNEVKTALSTGIDVLQGLNFKKIIIDPGFGFAKNLSQNYLLLKHMSDFAAMGFPVLAGLSRKSMINRVLGTSAVTALNGTTVLNTLALVNGANILRVHDVTEAKQAIELITFYQSTK